MSMVESEKAIGEERETAEELTMPEDLPVAKGNRLE
jgi:hypothetical protein